MSVAFKSVSSYKTISRYAAVRSDLPGEFMMIHKSILEIDKSYQRDANDPKVANIAKEWSWIGCGVLTVALTNGQYRVMDGQHRLEAARLRDDIQDLPCLVFPVEDISEEASGFLVANTARRAVSAIDKHRASVIAGDPLAVFIQEQLDASGYKLSKTDKNPKQMNCIHSCRSLASKDKDAFKKCFELATKLSDDAGIPLRERLLEGLFYINKNVEGGLGDERLLKRIKHVGAEKLLMGATRASAYYACGGEKVWATGMLDVINHGLRLSKFEFSSTKGPKS